MHKAPPILLVVIGCLQPSPAEEPPTIGGKTVDGWIKVLRDKSGTERDRRKAVGALFDFGKEAKAAVPDLVDVFRQGEFQEEISRALVEIGGGEQVIVPRLIERFHKEGCLQLTAAGAIGFNPNVRDSLVKIGGPAVPALLEVLNGPDKPMRVCAAEALGRIGPASRAAIPALIRAIEQPEPNPDFDALGHQAVIALGRIGPGAKAAIPALNGLLDEENADRFSVVMALEGIGAPPVRKLLDICLRDGDSFSVYALACLGPKAREATPALRIALADKQHRAHLSAAVALAHIEPTALEPIPVLIEALSHVDAETLDVWDVPRALARFGPGARAAMRPLIGLVEKGEPDNDLLRALVLIDPEGKECLPALVSVLKTGDFQAAETAADCLGLLGPRASIAIPALAEAVTRDFHEVFYNGHQPQVAAAKALRRIDREAKSAIPALIAALKYWHVARDIVDGKEQRDYSAAEAAAQVLGSFGVEAKAAVPALIETVQDRERAGERDLVRRAAILALGRIGPDAKAAIPILRTLLAEKRGQPSYRFEATIALYRLAPDGRVLAEEWLANPSNAPVGRMDFPFAEMLGAMGRTSFEADCATRRLLGWLDQTLAHLDAIEGDRIEDYEWWFEKLGRLGTAGRSAVPRLREFGKHPSPWVRMWAKETLEQILVPSRR